MTTVVSPGASETSYFNKSGVAILDLTCGNTPGSPVVIPADAGTVVANLHGPANTDPIVNFIVDTGFQVGDVLECYSTDYPYGLTVFDTDGVTGIGAVASVGNPNTFMARKTATGWVTFGKG